MPESSVSVDITLDGVHLYINSESEEAYFEFKYADLSSARELDRVFSLIELLGYVEPDPDTEMDAIEVNHEGVKAHLFIVTSPEIVSFDEALHSIAE